MQNLPVQSLQFTDIKENFKEFLRGQSAYTDYNFEGSGVATLVNVASYQTHYIGYFVKMLLDEAFSDSAHTRGAQLSHAKRAGYVPKGKRSASAEVTLKIHTNLAEEPSSHFLEIPRGATFVAANSTQDQRVFTVIDGSTIYKREVTGSNVTYTSEPQAIYEGVLESWNFKVDSTILNQRFIIRDKTIDIDSIRVRVKPNQFSVNWTEFTLASQITDLDSTSNIFFISTDEHGNYQIFFGNGVFGVQPENGNYIEVTYVSTNGESGNGAKVFSFNPVGSGALAAYSNFETLTLSNAAGGREEETIEELRFAIPNHWRRQNRLVTEGDYRSILLSEFRNIDSMNVWGGEENIRRDYGKVYVSIKPRNAERLTALAREQIRTSIVKKFGVVGADVVFVDPDFIEVELTVNAKLDLRKTSKSLPEMIALINDRVGEFNTTQLSKFDAILSDLALLNTIKKDDETFVGLYDTKVLTKNYLHLHNSTSSQDVAFGNALIPASIKSSAVTVAGTSLTAKDDGAGLLKLYRADGTVYSTIGSVNYATGTVTYALPAAARIIGYELSTYGRIAFSGVPLTPDVGTSLNNIVRISKVKVVTG